MAASLFSSTCHAGGLICPVDLDGAVKDRPALIGQLKSIVWLDGQQSPTVESVYSVLSRRGVIVFDKGVADPRVRYRFTYEFDRVDAATDGEDLLKAALSDVDRQVANIDGSLLLVLRRSCRGFEPCQSIEHQSPDCSLTGRCCVDEKIAEGDNQGSTWLVE